MFELDVKAILLEKGYKVTKTDSHGFTYWSNGEKVIFLTDKDVTIVLDRNVGLDTIQSTL